MTLLIGSRIIGCSIRKIGKVYPVAVMLFLLIPFAVSFSAAVSSLHYAGVHLHPFALSLELRDLTAGKTVFRAEAENISRGIGLSRVATFTSVRGEPVYKGHEYELVSEFNNTTPADQDAMASMFLYLRDKEFRKPSLN